MRQEPEPVFLRFWPFPSLSKPSAEMVRYVIPAAAMHKKNSHPPAPPSVSVPDFLERQWFLVERRESDLGAWP